MGTNLTSQSQLRALDWIANQDNRYLLPTNDDNNAVELLQRFLVVDFYFSTSLDHPWTDCNPIDDDNKTNNDNISNVTSTGHRSNSLCYYEANYAYTYLGGSQAITYTFLPNQYEIVTAVRWLSTEYHECQWAGLFCNDQRQVQALHLERMNLTGTLPEHLHLLNGLTTLSLKENSLRGTLPVSLSKLTTLSALDLGTNQFTGTVPSNWWHPRQRQESHSSNSNSKSSADGNSNNSNTTTWMLRHMSLQSNQLSKWRIPTDIGMTSLKYLYLMDAGLTGSIPTQISRMTELIWLELHVNALTSTIPTDFGLLSNLEFLALSHNLLTGTLPSELALLSQLWELTVWTNEIIGTIPEEIYLTNYTALQALIFGHNDLTGSISTNIGKLSTLSYLYFPGLDLTGTIPTEIGLLSDLAKVHFDGTDLTGSVPSELCSLRGNFLTVIKADCQMISTGEIPMECALGCCTKCCNRESGTCNEP